MIGFHYSVCPVSGKVMLTSRRRARQFAIRQKRIHGHGYKVYFCSHCKSWHLATRRRGD